jgi:hypothetical protein
VSEDSLQNGISIDEKDMRKKVEGEVPSRMSRKETSQGQVEIPFS